MRTTAIICATLAGSLGFGSIASAQDWHGHRGGHENAQHWQHDGGGHRNWQQGAARVENRHWNGGGWHQPHYVYNQPRYAYHGAGWYGPAPHFHRGAYLPRAYLDGGYYVSNWSAYPGLYAPPYGYRWVNVGGDFLLVALATGLIANALMH